MKNTLVNKRVEKYAQRDSLSTEERERGVGSGQQQPTAMDALAVLASSTPVVSRHDPTGKHVGLSPFHPKKLPQCLSSFHPSLALSSSSSSSASLRLTRSTPRRAKARVLRHQIVASVEKVEETYIMIKPDGVQRGLVGEIISRFEKKGFRLKGLKLFQCPTELAEEHYKDLKSKPFFPNLIEYITSGPVVCMAWEGAGVVQSARKLIGATNPLQAEPGTIRGDLAVETGRNVVHGSDSPENGEREMALWFKEGELIQWTPTLAPWLRE